LKCDTRTKIDGHLERDEEKRGERESNVLLIFYSRCCNVSLLTAWTKIISCSLLCF